MLTFKWKIMWRLSIPSPRSGRSHVTSLFVLAWSCDWLSDTMKGVWTLKQHFFFQTESNKIICDFLQISCLSYTVKHLFAIFIIQKSCTINSVGFYFICYTYCRLKPKALELYSQTDSSLNIAFIDCKVFLIKFLQSLPKLL